MIRREHKLSNSQYARRQLKVFAVALRNFRRARSMPRHKLSDKVGCSEQTIYNIENSNIYPSFSLYVSLCRAMGEKPLPIFE